MGIVHVKKDIGSHGLCILYEKRLSNKTKTLKKIGLIKKDVYFLYYFFFLS